MSIAQQLMEQEMTMLSPGATRSLQSRGRERPEEDCRLRTHFQRDRDRVLHCNSFRRLSHKTQVFLSPEGDHYRTRLTHTLEVSQIARTIARALRLNEDLTEAIALGHDLGHTPFGHAGEKALNKFCPGGFSHNLQSVRVVERLERGGKGLNLCYEVRDGIACHSSGRGTAQTLEGRVVRYSDKIAYMNHDVDDAIRAGILLESELPWQVHHTLGRNKSQRITSLIEDIVANSTDDDILMSPEVLECYKLFRSFMFEQVYTNPTAKREETKVDDMLHRMYSYFLKQPEKLSDEYSEIAQTEGVERAACDYLSGMSDRYCITLFEQLFIPKSWQVL